MRLTQILSLLFATIAALVFYYFISSSEKPEARTAAKKTPISTTQILVVAREMDTGDLIQSGDLKWVEWPKSLVTPDLFVKGKAEIESLVNSMVLYKIGANSPIRTYYITSKKQGGRLSLTLAPNKKAFTLLIGSFANPDVNLAVGDRVDLVSAAKADDTKQTRPSILRAIKIISASSGLGGVAGVKPTVTIPTSLTFEVSESQASQLAEMAQRGSLYISHTSAFAGQNLSPTEMAKAQAEEGVKEDSAKAAEQEEITIIRGEAAETVQQ